MTLGPISATGDFTVEVLTDGSPSQHYAHTNLWLSNGIGLLATWQMDALDTAKLGSSASVPALGDTTLPGYLVSVGREGYMSGAAYPSATPAPYTEYTVTFLSGVGGATGTYTTVGIGNGGGAGVYAWSQIKDGNGSPVSVTVLSTEQIRITYRVRIYVEGTGVSTGSVVINGTTHTFTAYRTGFATGTVGVSSTFFTRFVEFYAWNGAGGGVVFTPPTTPTAGWSATNIYQNYYASSGYGGDALSIGGYDSATQSRTCTVSANINEANGQTHIIKLYGEAASASTWVIHLDTPITKTSTQSLALTFRTYFGLYTGAIS